MDNHDAPAPAPTPNSLTPTTWDAAGLKERGWEGFIPLSTLVGKDVPNVPGVYVVIRESTQDAVICEKGIHQAEKQVAPYGVDELAQRWIKGASVVYIGKASTSLRKRLGQYRRAGMAGGTNHNGGRSIWQLDDAEDLLVAWHPVDQDESGLEAAEMETQLIGAFKATHGNRPFANRNK
ncbi:hypothetical protein AB0E44_06095 [Micrococcus terreus]|uniref:hypothetical protein n=1 Tax=Micrococcus terreus TaxID=574650 RepID=UPI0033E46F18